MFTTETNSGGVAAAGSEARLSAMNFAATTPICSMYDVWNIYRTNICPRNHPNVGKYTIHGAYGTDPTDRNVKLHC